MSAGVSMIAQERLRQVSEEGWTAEHDDDHENGELALAAICYATPPDEVIRRENGAYFVDPWPWDEEYDKRGEDSELRCLVKAGALIAAEIDRHLRLHPDRAPKTSPASVDDETWVRIRRHLVLSLEAAVDRGKLQPFQALEVADHFGVPAPPSIAAKHEHYSRSHA